MYMHRNAHTRARKQTCTDVGTTNMSGNTTPEDADHTHACTRIHTYAYRIRMHSHTCICVYVYVYVYVRVYVHVYMCVYVHVYMCVHVHVYVCAWHKQIYADEGTNMGIRNMWIMHMHVDPTGMNGSVHVRIHMHA